MFEEIAVWKRDIPKVAIRYVGFRNLETDLVWIAFANYVGIDEEEECEIGANELICPNTTLDYFLNAFPADAELWKPTILEAVAVFRERNPDT